MRSAERRFILLPLDFEDDEQIVAVTERQQQLHIVALRNTETVHKCAGGLAQCDEAQAKKLANNCLLAPFMLPGTIIKYMHSFPNDKESSICFHLVNALKENPLQAIQCINEDLRHGDRSSSDRIKLLQFLYKFLAIEALNDDAVDLLIYVARDVVFDCTEQEFRIAFTFLKESKLSSTVVGRQEIIFLALRRAGVTKKFNVDDNQALATCNRMIECIKAILPYFSVEIACDPLILYLCLEVLPNWKAIGRNCGAFHQSEILKIITELCMKGDIVDRPRNALGPVFYVLRNVVPSPTKKIDINFQNVECTLYIFHFLARQCLNLSFSPDLLQDIKNRLYHLIETMRIFMVSLRSRPRCNTSVIRKCKLLFRNISTLINGLLLSPMIFRPNVIPSFKQPVGIRPQKRSLTQLNTPINSKRSRSSQQG